MTDTVLDDGASLPPGDPPPDQPARDRIVLELDRTLFVEAGAGSGKTSALVDRVLALVAGGDVELQRVAAITFTEKAGDELRDRIRRRLDDSLRRTTDGVAASRLRRALDQLDGAAIGTLHAFAQRLLSEHPVEAGLPPRVEVLDEVSSAAAFDQRWSVFQDRLLADVDLQRTLLLLFAAGCRPDALRNVALAFEDNWDLVASHVPADPPEPPPVAALAAEAISHARRLCREPCRDPGDKLAVKVGALGAHVDALADVDGELDLLEALGGLPSFKVGKAGRPPSWDCDLDVFRQQLADAGDRLRAVRGQVAEACAQRVAAAIGDFTLEAAAERRRAGRLQFHDLLVLARSLLCSPEHGAEVRRRLHGRYTRVLLDEFQDTDPIQIELAVRIAAADPSSAAAGAAPWDEVDVTPGHLFFVGDPKQSIYRFRRADISTFLRAAERFGSPAGGGVGLTTNFRTVEPVVDWVNATFAPLTADSSDPDLPVASQAPYVALQPTRPAPPAGAAVSVVGRDELARDLRADDVRTVEAAAVAAAVARILHDRWDVDAGDGTWRPARLGDITVLVPARTSLPFLEDALEARRIPFRAEASSLVYASRAVRDLLMVLRAVDDPTNALHLLAALRTPLLACGDDDLFRFRHERRGRLNILAGQPETVPTDDPVLAAMAYLRTVYDDRHWVGPAELLDRIALERRALELGFTEGRPRDVWRRLRFVRDQARAWSDATGGNLRQYLTWVGRQAAEGARVAEAVLPETDDDAVRIMTIHSAKGLEFPIAVLSGMSTAPQNAARAGAQVLFRPDGSVGYKLGAAVETREFRDWKPIDEQMALDERVRLLYVACTRARDHLVVSLHRKARVKEPEHPSRLTNAELLLGGMAAGPGGDGVLASLPDAAADVGAVPPVTLEAPAAPPPYEEWHDVRTTALADASRPTTVAATALTDEGGADTGTEPRADADSDADVEAGPGTGGDPGLRKRPRDLDLPPWLKGRYGTAVGRAVHGVLQTVDLATGAGLDAAVAAQCEAEAVVDRVADVAALVRAALGTPTLQAAATAPHWREVYVCVPIGDRLLEGYVDLLYRGVDGLVVVDYKTAATSDAAELDRRVAGYRNQGASYALAVATATAEPVADVVFCFLTPGGAVERHLADLDLAVADVRALVAGGREVVTL